MNAKGRINLVVSERTKDRLTELQDRMDSSSLSEVIRKAVELLDIVTDHQTKGDAVIIKGADGETEIRILM